MRIFSLLILVSIFFYSCVSNRKYSEELTARKKAQDEAAILTQNNKDLEKKWKETDDKLSKALIETKQMQADYELLQGRYNQQQRLNKDLQDSYDKLLALNDKLKEEATQQKRNLDDLLAERTRELERRERSARDLEESLRRERESIDKLRKDLEGKDANIIDLEKYKRELEDNLREREKRIKDLESAIAERDAQTKALKDKLNEALKGFADAVDLQVEVRNGKVYVSLSQKLLFATGSFVVDKRGLDALKSLAGVLVKSPELNVMVEGHTDSDGDEKLNWDLSSNRALSVTQQLIKNGVQPDKITAAGRGEHAPKASNSTDNGKASNRRTEIILEPKLNEIMGILTK